MGDDHHLSEGKMPNVLTVSTWMCIPARVWHARNCLPGSIHLNVYLVAHPTARKWNITPVISGLTLLIPFTTGVIAHLRAVGSSPPSIIFQAKNDGSEVIRVSQNCLRQIESCSQPRSIFVDVPSFNSPQISTSIGPLFFVRADGGQTAQKIIRQCPLPKSPHLQWLLSLLPPNGFHAKWKTPRAKAETAPGAGETCDSYATNRSLFIFVCETVYLTIYI